MEVFDVILSTLEVKRSTTIHVHYENLIEEICGKRVNSEDKMRSRNRVDQNFNLSILVWKIEVPLDCFTGGIIDTDLGMDVLPIEIIFLFGRYVNFKDLKSLSTVNKRFRSILIRKIYEFPKF